MKLLMVVTVNLVGLCMLTSRRLLFLVRCRVRVLIERDRKGTDLGDAATGHSKSLKTTFNSITNFSKIPRWKTPLQS